MGISVPKTKHLFTDTNSSVSINGQQLEQVEEFKYLGSLIDIRDGASCEIKPRISMAWRTFGQLRKSLWSRREISLKTKLRVYVACIHYTLLYGCTTWPLKEEEERSLDILDRKCLRAIGNLKLSKRISNEQLM
jgi:hypothetical protein